MKKPRYSVEHYICWHSSDHPTTGIVVKKNGWFFTSFYVADHLVGKILSIELKNNRWVHIQGEKCLEIRSVSGILKERAGCKNPYFDIDEGPYLDSIKRPL
jgi:hypothetical protein